MQLRHKRIAGLSVQIWELDQRLPSRDHDPGDQMMMYRMVVATTTHLLDRQTIWKNGFPSRLAIDSS